MKLAINGFGRIGRQALRIIQERDLPIEVVLINDLTNGETLAHLFEWDSTYGHYDCGDTCFKDGMLSTKHGKIRTTAVPDPENLPHKEMEVDVVLECTGFFRHKEKAQKHITAGAKKVVLSAPGKDEIDGTFCMGVNDDTYDADSMHIVSNASCTTNCLAPISKVLNDNFGIQQGFITTIHSYTSSQHLVDSPDKDLRRARAGAVNLIPTSTGAAKAIGLVVPELDGKLDGMAVRVPTLTGSLTDLTCIVEKACDEAAVNAAFEKASLGAMKGVLGYETRPLVLQDFVQDPRSSIVDAPSTKVRTEDGQTLVKVLSWYDNEWGYSNRLVELAMKLGESL